MPKQEGRKDINPQLCKTMNPAKHTWEHPWIAEPKFDGLRCMVLVDKKGKATAWSRNGLPLYNMRYVLENVEEAGFQDYVLDGEVYTKDWNLSMGIVKSSVTEHPDADKLSYHVWDCLLGDEARSHWTDRFGKHPMYTAVSNQERMETRLWPWITLELPHVQIVRGIKVHNDTELQNAYSQFLADGYEGAILKCPTGAYQGGRRSPYWLKIKPWTDADLTVVGTYPGEGKHLGRIGGLVLQGTAEFNGTSYDVSTEVGTGFTDEEREWWQKQADAGTAIGRIVEIKFQDITVDNACRFPVYHRLREDKE